MTITLIGKEAQDYLDYHSAITIAIQDTKGVVVTRDDYIKLLNQEESGTSSLADHTPVKDKVYNRSMDEVFGRGPGISSGTHWTSHEVGLVTTAIHSAANLNALVQMLPNRTVAAVTARVYLEEGTVKNGIVGKL